MGGGGAVGVVLAVIESGFLQLACQVVVPRSLHLQRCQTLTCDMLSAVLCHLCVCVWLLPDPLASLCFFDLETACKLHMCTPMR